MSMEAVFKERQTFENKEIENMQKELKQFSLRIAPGYSWQRILRYPQPKAHEEALNQEKIDVAEARMKGKIGEAEKEGRMKQEISKIDADTARQETKRKAEKAKAGSELMSRQTELDPVFKLQKPVESTRAETEPERLRASEVTKSKVVRESAEQDADAAYYTEQKAADAQLYKQKMAADATYYRQSKEADASLYQQKREAEGIFEMAKAYGALIDVLGGPQAFLQFRMENGRYERLAKATARLSEDFNQRSRDGILVRDGSGDSIAPVRNIMQGLPPLLDTIHEQTGMSPPSWLA
ncbi:hypothetical protein BDV29DRAFT_152125 [Aspergillus leporis]|uniref:Flotillin domain protein n=1 Tax=Aspergillus leporis TaxID=41062 RepID=A0A5N5XFP7_9EURO|nr:hypothetical protein BDV29DRAFT_152125 [Aspergillus leporis]